jgi:hypothetical protein
MFFYAVRSTKHIEEVKKKMDGPRISPSRPKRLDSASARASIFFDCGKILEKCPDFSLEVQVGSEESEIVPSEFWALAH